MVEEARLESVYTPKAYRGFESPSLRKIVYKPLKNQWFFFYLYVLFPFLLSLRFLENHIKIRQRSSSLFFINFQNLFELLVDNHKITEQLDGCFPVDDISFVI